MKNLKRLSLLLISLSSACALYAAEPVIELWKGVKMPGTACTEAEVVQGAQTKNDRGYQFVSVPTLEFFKAESEKPTAAIIICPGGGYGHLAYGKEGTEIARFLNESGVNCFVLKYRIPNNRDGALQDAQRALRLVRQNAKAWNVDPNKVGIMGFSAGGHLSARTSTNFDTDSYEALDKADKLSARPDFTVLVYPAYCADNNTYELKPEIRISEKTPPAFIIQSVDDKHYVGSAIGYFLALKKFGVNADLHLFAVGGHGYGLREKTKPVGTWGDTLTTWLKFNKLAE